MAYIVINSLFKPFSYDEMIKPVEALNKAHIENMNNNTKLAESATSVGELLDQEKDKELYQLYLNYKLNLSDLASIMATLGSTPDTIRDINNLRTSYHKEIEPIKVGYDNFMKFRDELNKEKQAARTRDDHVIFEKDASNLSTTDFVKNPALTSTMVSGNAVYKNAFNQASLIRKELIHNPDKYKGILSYGGIPAAYQRFVTYGATSEEVSNAVNEYKRLSQNYNSELMEQAIMNDKNANPLLMLMMNRAVMDSGVLNWDNENINKNEAFNLAVNKAGEGLFGAVGTSTPDTVNNPFASALLSRSYASKPSIPDIPEKGNYPWNPTNYVTVDEKKKTTALEEDKKAIETYMNLKPEIKKGERNLIDAYNKVFYELKALDDYNNSVGPNQKRDRTELARKFSEVDNKLRHYREDNNIPKNINEVRERYHGMSHKGMVDYINNEIASSVELNNTMVLNTTDNDKYSGRLLNKAMGTPMYNLEICDELGNTIRDVKESDIPDIKKITGKDLIFNRRNGAIYIRGTITDPKGGNRTIRVKFKKGVLPFRDNAENDYSEMIDGRENYIKDNDYDKFKTYLNKCSKNLLGQLYEMMEDTTPVTGDTSLKIDSSNEQLSAE